ncbi:hypothetical protein Y032_0004g1911 [Ancylostoma ceylanicum]|uniref:Death domain-containing protein n=1 Tax=Ancylostoma ceylanicum TaxID=53326 RepID=A0A016VUH8_9BILA|nr:hypothetical protein Y032_0004g1911 [Ancylostoma ceylanicum]
MEELVKKRDFEGLKNYFASCRESVSEEDFSSLLEVRLRERGLDIARGPDETIEENVRRHLEFALNVCKNGLCVKQTAVQTLQDMFEVSGIGRCERLFGILEENMFQFKQSPLVESSQTQILRMCNDLLKRLSRSAETSFCGRILFFLSRYLPLGEKSGLNLMGHFNTQNITKFDTTETQSVDLINISDEETETGEIKEAKEINIPVDHALYSMFWQMQDFFSNPVLCFDKQQWDIFQKNSSDVLGVFSSYKLEKSGDDDDENGRKRSAMPENLHELIDEADSYFAKYLTSPKLLQLQLNDSQFRRYFLIQFIILCQYLTSSRPKQKNTSLSDDQTKFVNESQEKCYRLLRETHPKGAQFAENVKHILQRELEWAKWKSESCPAMTDLADKQPMQPYKKRPRTTFNPAVVDVGSAELNKLWSIQPNLLEACRNEKRKFAPSLTEFLRDPIDELDPEQQVEDQYKYVEGTPSGQVYKDQCRDAASHSGCLLHSFTDNALIMFSDTLYPTLAHHNFGLSTRDPAFQFRACRLLMAESSQYISAQSQQTLNIPLFLDNVILKTGKGMEEFRDELQEREERQAKKAVEESLLRNRSNGIEGSASPSPDYEMSDSTLSKLSSILAPQWKVLAEAMEVNSKKLEEVKGKTNEECCAAVIKQWTEANGRNFKMMRNLLLKAHLLSEVVVDLLKVSFPI